MTNKQSWAAYYDIAYTLPEICDHLAHKARFIAMCEKWFAGKRILEIGTGTGLVSIYFSQSGYDVTGMDRDAGVIRRNAVLSERLGGQARWIVGDMFHPPLDTGHFDACFHQGLLEHFDEPQIVEALHIQLVHCRRVIFSVPTDKWRGGVFGDERLWPGTYWRKLLEPFRVLDVFGEAYGSLPLRTLNFLTKRSLFQRPAALHRQLALRHAGDLGFVIEKKAGG